MTMRSRRKFLGEASCAAIGSTSVLSTLLNLTMANHAAAQGGFGGQRKSLVCVFLSGGCDTFNLLVPGIPCMPAESATRPACLTRGRRRRATNPSSEKPAGSRKSPPAPVPKPALTSTESAGRCCWAPRGADRATANAASSGTREPTGCVTAVRIKA